MPNLIIFLIISQKYKELPDFREISDTIEMFVRLSQKYSQNFFFQNMQNFVFSRQWKRHFCWNPSDKSIMHISFNTFVSSLAHRSHRGNKLLELFCCSLIWPLPPLSSLQRQNTEISKQIFPEKEYLGLSPNFHIHASVSHLYIPTIRLSILREEICRVVDLSWDFINRSLAHECWNWGWGRAIPRKGIHKGDFRCSAHLLHYFLPLVFLLSTSMQKAWKQVFINILKI